MTDCQAVLEQDQDSKTACEAPVMEEPSCSYTVQTAPGDACINFSWDCSKGYDALNRMVSFNDGTVSESYALRGIEEIRTSKTSNGVTTTYLLDGLNVLAEYENGTLVRQYIYGIWPFAYVDEPLAKYRPGQSALYYTRNDLYSVASLTNAAGAAVERYKYEAFGNRTIYAPDGVTIRATSSYGDHIGFQGRDHDNTGLIYYRARMDDPNLGRFLERDPINNTPSVMNFYSFVSNDPTRFTDPSGCITCVPSAPGQGPWRVFQLSLSGTTPSAQAVANTMAAMALSALSGGGAPSFPTNGYKFYVSIRFSRADWCTCTCTCPTKTCTPAQVEYTVWLGGENAGGTYLWCGNPADLSPMVDDAKTKITNPDYNPATCTCP